MKVMPDGRDEDRAVALYAVAARDFTDYLDMLDEPETTPESLQILKEMCEFIDKSKKTDHELNAIMLPGIKRRIELMKKFNERAY